jgi:hypothetical protein
MSSSIKNTLFNLYLKITKKEKAHFLHIGKTGGTAIKHAINTHLSTQKYAILLHGHETKLSDIPKGEKVFFILRDPVNRFISGFYSRQRQGQPRYFYPWSESEKIAFERFKRPNDLASAIFSEDEMTRRNAENAMSAIQHVKDSYWSWFDNEEYLRERLQDIIFVGHQENLSQSFENLKTTLGLPMHIKLPSDDKIAHKNPENLDKSLDETAIKNLKSWYQDDYRILEIINSNFR